MVHILAAEGHQSRRKRSKMPSYSSSCEELSVNNSKVQVREQAYRHETNSAPSSALPVGFEEHFCQLMSLEMTYHPRTDNLFNSDVCEDKVDAELRDDAVFNLRFLHKFHNLAPECFAHAVNMTDRFLARVKVKPKYMACLATAAYLIAAKMIENRENWPSPDKLVRMARCGGSPEDLERMEAIIRAKLRPIGGCGGGGGIESAVTPLHFLALLRPLFSSDRAYQGAVGQLETCLCSVAVYCYRPALLALCVARRYLGGGDSSAIERVARLLHLPDPDLAQCDSIVEEVEGLRLGGRRQSGRAGNIRRRIAVADSPPPAWQGLRRLQRCRRRRPTSLTSCSRGGLETIREEGQQILGEEEDCSLVYVAGCFADALAAA